MTSPRYPLSDHCDGQRFFNPRLHINRTFREIWRWKRTSRPAPWPNAVALRRPAAVDRAPGDLVVTWINHATVLIETPAGRILTDPVFSRCAGPFGQFGPSRVHAPAILLDDLPTISVVFLSHDHYDHCDLGSLRRLRRRFPALRAVTPLGNGELFERAGFDRAQIQELDWWQHVAPLPGADLWATPARHWSNRLSGPRNGRLWSGFFLRFGERTILFSGDTAYDSEFFPEIRRRLGAPDLAILPIGAYEPRWFMAAQHCNPAEAVQIHRDLEATRSFGVHWGTFQLTDEAREAPLAALEAARTDAGVSPEEFPSLQPGDSIVIPPRLARVPTRP